VEDNSHVPSRSEGAEEPHAKNPPSQNATTLSPTLFSSSHRDSPETLLLTLAAIAEKHSEHPLATAILAEAARRQLQIPTPDSFTAHPGQGITATFNNHRILIGNEAWMLANSINLSPRGTTSTDTSASQ
jgi:cation transport ATPase